MRRKPVPKPRSVAAKALGSPLFRARQVEPLKGKASYKRRPKHRGGASVLRVVSRLSPYRSARGSSAA